MHQEEKLKFGMTIVRTYSSAFTLAMKEVIRIRLLGHYVLDDIPELQEQT